MIVGIDEVGRGAWAGPVVVAVVGLGGIEIEGLTDSKLLSKKRREAFSQQIKESAPLVGIGWVSARDIDTIGLSAALKLATRRAVAQIDLSQVDQIIIDGTIKLLDDSRVALMKKADLLVPSVSAASVIAKVARDHYMTLCDEIFPGYGFAGHVGYGAEKHHQAIKQMGVTPIHRMSFAPMKNEVLTQRERINQHMKNNEDSTTTSIGHQAEQAVVEHLQRNGYEIIEQNWKTKWCEVDIIASRKNVMYFVEVKYRRSTRQGGGIAAITPGKLRQMRFAAELWLQSRPGLDARLAVCEVTGDTYDVTQLIDNVS